MKPVSILSARELSARAALHDTSDAKLRRAPKPPPRALLIAELRMTRDVYDRILESVGSLRAETGGMLLAEPGTYTVTDFVFDSGAQCSGASYQPDVAFLNSALQGRDRCFAGIVHSHPAGCRELSAQDRRAAWSNLTSPRNDHLDARRGAQALEPARQPPDAFQP